MKNFLPQNLIFCLLAIIILTISCQTLDPVSLTKFSNNPLVASEIKYNSATITSKFMDVGDGTTSYGHCWAITQNPTIDNFKAINSGTPYKLVEFTSQLTDLLAETKYYVRAYAESSGKTIYSDEINFTTLALPITVTTNAISAVSITSATSGGTISAEAGITITARGVCWDIASNPTIALITKTTDGAGTGSFVSNLSGLKAKTNYYVRAYASTSAGTVYGNEIGFTTFTAGSYIVNDVEGNIYHTVAIGNQTWMVENLKTTKYSDGTTITGVYVSPNIQNYAEVYGRLYTWQAVMNGSGSSMSNPSGVRGVCPVGWHVPSIYEFVELTNYLGGDNVAGGKMKEIGTSHWTSQNIGADNSSGFTALPTDERSPQGLYASPILLHMTLFWTSSAQDATWAMSPRLFNDSTKVSYSWVYNKLIAAPVRCIKGESVTLPTISTTPISSITQTTASSGGNITNDGGAAITARGVCWGTASNPSLHLQQKLPMVAALVHLQVQ